MRLAPPRSDFFQNSVEGILVNSRARRNGHAKNLTNASCRPFLNVTVARDGRIFAGGSVYPDIVLPSMVAEVAALVTQVFFQFGTLHPLSLRGRQFGNSLRIPLAGFTQRLNGIARHIEGFLESFGFSDQLRLQR